MNEDGEIPITPGEIENCSRCMRLVRMELARGKSAPTMQELSAVHFIVHRAPWEPLDGQYADERDKL